MSDVWVGLLAVLIGLAFCFRGYFAMRIIIPLWGAFFGFLLGAGLVASFADEGFLASLLAWLVALIVAFVFGLLAYLYYEVSVLLAMSAIGFTLATTAMAALGVEWSWLIIFIGVIAGALLAVLAILADLPMVLLVVLTATAGAAAAVVGTMLLVGVVSADDFTSAGTTASVEDDWWWYATYLVLTIAGIVAQLRATAQARTSMRDSWSQSGGRQLRPR